MYAAADNLKQSIDEKNAKIRALTDEIPTLKSDISQLRFLFTAHSTKPDAMTQTKVAAAREIAEKHGVKSEADIEKLCLHITKNNLSKVAALERLFQY